jgi:hypothetical protein
MKLLLAILFILITTVSFGTTYYVDATLGNDSNNGITPETAWKTLNRLNNAMISPGDSILFKRGEVFRGNLIPVIGSDPDYVTYGAYGTGNKPKILGSYNRNSAFYWIDEGENIWRMVQPAATLSSLELLPNPDFGDNISNWDIYNSSENGASSQFERTSNPNEYYTTPGGGKLVCQNNGLIQSDIQIFTYSWPITSSKWYKFSFKAKATEQFTMNSTNITLMKESSPWTNYSSSQTIKDVTFTTTWTTYEFVYETNITANDARITFYFGNIIPEGATFYFDSLSFKEFSGNPELLTMDVGNIIFNNESFCGIKVWDETALDKQGEFWYDENNETLKLYSVSNPALYYSDIELALRQNIIDISYKSYIVFDNLDLRYGAVDGVQGINTHHIWIKDMDISYMGGGDQYGGTETVRFGNGVSFLVGAHDNIVERCTFNQIYDAAMSPQGGSAPQGFEVYNLYFRNNIVRNCEYSFEFWAQSDKATVSNVYFVNNTCMNAGGGWGHAQRPDPNGNHLMFFSNDATTSSFYVINNIFCNSTEEGVRWARIDNISEVFMDNNCWFETSGNIARIENNYYDYGSQWEEYKATTQQDIHSIAADPLLAPDYTLLDNSPCINAGSTISSVNQDYNGVSRPQGNKYDIGAFESNVLTTLENASKIDKVLLYPNLVNNFLTIETPGLDIASKLYIYNINGQELMSQQIDQTKMEIDLSNLLPGVYILRIINDKSVEVRKIIKK